MDGLSSMTSYQRWRMSRLGCFQSMASVALFAIHKPAVIAGIICGTAQHFSLFSKFQQYIRRVATRQKVTGVRNLRSRIRIATTRQHLNERLSAHLNITSHESEPQDVPQPENSSSSDSSVVDESVQSVLDNCNVQRVTEFALALPFWKQKSANKIAEGTYGEVYHFIHIDGTHRIFKCIPLGGRHPEASYENISLEMAVPDIVSSKCLSSLNQGSTYAAPNFPEIFSMHIVRDKFPQRLMRTWLEYRNHPERSGDPAEHPSPVDYPNDQAYLTIESSFCGTPLTGEDLQNAWVGVSIMTQVTAALAVAEAAYNFEHRDLHLENILLKKTNVTSLKYTINQCNFDVQIRGYQVFIIDFGLSRILNDGKVHCIELTDLSTSSDNTQHEVAGNFWLKHGNMYKIMTEYSRNRWGEYMPVTNIMWLKYLLENILYHLQHNAPDTLLQAQALRMLRRWNRDIQERNSAHDLLVNVVRSEENPLVYFYE